MLKYQIFVSSTYEDLKPERDQVIKAILEMGHIPVGMEMFSAGDEQQWDVIKKQIDQSDYYVVLIAHRYGSMDGTISYTEKEYDYALSQGLPTLGFILDEDVVDWPEEWKENNNDIHKRLEAFRSKVSNKMVDFWKNADDLYGKCAIALMKAFSTHPREGWVRASSSAHVTEMTEEIMRLSRENGKLRTDLEQIKAIRITSESEKINQLIDALRFNKRNVYLWSYTDSKWNGPNNTNLLQIFELVAPDLLDEASDRTLADSISLGFGSLNNGRLEWPVPMNFIKAYLADFVSLDLVDNSTKRHSVKDTQAYWSLTELGKQVRGSIRKNELLKGLANSPSEPDGNGNSKKEEMA
uniref:DUF4062 domain-containing protein n=1 Tax=Candidatus Kentrum sp. FW TaxID=2126338 RepID=A0A450U1Q6_9GAMM|nr:MAG: protein of unknown function (DUF4062) [Candidatus Kentron sp. FW]